jgi:tetratricopeptide (TPR) repeat protein
MLNSVLGAQFWRNGAGFPRVIAALAVGFVTCFSGLLQANEPPPPELPRQTAKAVPKSTEGTDDIEGPAERLEPKTPETAKDKAHKDALAWFMSGRLKQAESRFSEALSDYQNAIKADPNAVEVYRALVPLAFALNETEKGLEYARKAVELDPQDLDILRILAEQLQEQHQVEKAAEYLSRASKSPKLKKDSSAYVILQLQLAPCITNCGNSIRPPTRIPSFSTPGATRRNTISTFKRGPRSNASGWPGTT